MTVSVAQKKRKIIDLEGLPRTGAMHQSLRHPVRWKECATLHAEYQCDIDQSWFSTQPSPADFANSSMDESLTSLSQS